MTEEAVQLVDPLTGSVFADVTDDLDFDESAEHIEVKEESEEQ